MAWFRVEASLANHRKVRKLARILVIPQAQALGHVVGLFCRACSESPDGSLAGWDGHDVADAAGWDGDPGTLCDALREVKFIVDGDSGPEINDWMEYAESYKAAQRKRKQRVPAVSQDRPVTAAGPSRSSHKDGRTDGPTDRTDETDGPTPSPSRTKPRDLSVQIQVVWGHYRQLHPQCSALLKSGDKRYHLIRQRLADGFATDALRKAIDGYHGSPFHQGENDRGKRYLGLGLIMRDADKVQAGIEMADNPDLGKDRRPQERTWIDEHNDMMAELAAKETPDAGSPGNPRDGPLGDPEVLVPPLQARA